MMKGNHVKIDMETTDTVLDVKKSLTKTEHVAHDVIQLFLKGKEIYDHNSLEKIKDKADSNDINLEVKERININVNMMSGDNCPLEMQSF